MTLQASRLMAVNETLRSVCQFILLFFKALCREMNQKIDSADEDRYDIDMKVTKNYKEVRRLMMISLFWTGDGAWMKAYPAFLGIKGYYDSHSLIFSRISPD
jgi:hypothetical protein